VVPGWRSVEQVAKSMASHGLSVVEVQADRQLRWSVQRPSRYARRITARTPIRLAGPAAGHALMRTSVDPQGVRVEGTLANCAGSATPWGTYLCGEENFHYYFEPPTTIDAHAKRWGLHAGSNQMLWSLREERFDLRLEPNEFHRYGWMVEVDPFDPESTPVKRTALGRAAHEGAACALNSDGRAVIFMGEDAVFEYLYKFVSRDPMRPGGATANRDLLDHGTLYVARFKTDGSGAWLPLVHGVGPLTAENGFADQAEVLIRSREAADLLAATRLDRPEWTAIDPNSGECYVSLTGNTLRGRIGYPSPDAVNPRGPNPLGHILRWRQRQDLADTRFEWDLFALAGDTAGDAFGGPDSLLIDPRGMLWVATDTPSTETLPRNQLLACDPTRSGGPEMRRFLVGPPGCEITGPVMAPDCRTLFVNIQHPGEKMGLQPPYAEAWPQPGLPPRSATIAITRLDGGIVGT
jgi:secreted PhoX family phosphatase